MLSANLIVNWLIIGWQQLSKQVLLQQLTETQQEMDVDITCPNCSKQYLDNNPPRLLSCGHTYCHLCLVSFAQENKNESLVCPEDQQNIKINTSVEHLPKNIALLRLIQCHKKNSSNNSSASMKDVFFDVSKITRQQECQEDLDAQQLISAIQRGSVNKESSLLTVDMSQIEIENKPIATKTDLIKPQEKKEQVELCLLHQRPIEVICMMDFQRLCSKCALFGQHKGHQFKSIEEIDRENHKSYQSIVTIFDQKEKLTQHITKKTIEKQIISVLRIKTNTLKKEITDKFKKLTEQLAKAQRGIYKKLDEASTLLSQRIRSKLQVDCDLSSFYECWESKALEILREGEKLSHEGKVTFYLQGNELQKQGKNLMTQLQKAQETAEFQTLKIIQEFRISFQQSDYYQSLNNLVHVFEKGKQQQDKKSQVLPRLKENEATYANRQKVELTKRNHAEKHESDESLLQFEEADTESLLGSISRSQLLNQSFVSTKDQFINKKGQYPGRLVKKNKSTFTAKQRVIVRKDSAIQPTVGREEIKKKLKMLKVPQKYQKVLQGIITDSLQTLDLTNAQLGDTQILKILDLMKMNTKVRSIKLIRNKITDQGLALMLPFLSNLITINLSQNQLTENSLLMFVDNKPNMPLLKNVILSQTKIVERKSKPLIERLKKMQVCVSV